MYNRLRTRLDAGRQDGFTLIELLIVIVILGILAAIVVFAVGGITDRGQGSACVSDKKTLQVAQEAHFAKEKAYADEGTLATKGYLASPSDLYNTSATAVNGTPAASYTVVTQDTTKCP